MILTVEKKYARIYIILALAFLLASCSSPGWGILLWSTEEPSIPSGTILRVLIRSNIDRVWVLNIPEKYRNGKDSQKKMEIPLSQFELAGSRGKAKKRAAAFSQYALTYAENLQDGLPIRDDPDNGGRRVYRLRTGEIIKILSRSEGNPPISTTGDPLPGDWYKVLTENGSTGYCFSYRLKFFEHSGGLLAAAPAAQEVIADPDLDMLLSKTWSPEFYEAMINDRRINLDELSKHWRFDPGQDSGVARIYIPSLDRAFSYNAIRSDGTRAWIFEGTSLQMNLRSDTSLAVQFVESSGIMRTLLFTALSADVDDLILQETARRERLYNTIYAQGPAFTSNNYGTIVFSPNGRFTWTGSSLLVPHVIPEGAQPQGIAAMDLFLEPSLAERYTGAFSFRFAGEAAPVRFMYNLDSQGFRLEFVPESSLEDTLVSRRASSPTVLYFFKDESPLPAQEG
ncbi:MAG: SH3 domain-containing protein [Treponema sp.]|jgi:hypothetical protein|nr:SH3 domain-containing protein [Treponema sp.]